jgi:hypothetical protein
MLGAMVHMLVLMVCGLLRTVRCDGRFGSARAGRGKWWVRVGAAALVFGVRALADDSRTDWFCRGAVRANESHVDNLSHD